MELSATVIVIDTGLANSASVLAGIQRAGARAQLSTDPETIMAAPAAVLPGVGRFAAGMRFLHERGLAPVVRQRVQQNLPLLAICLGLQLLFRASAEDPGVPGLALIDADLQRFPDTVSAPQLGWNNVLPSAGCVLLKPGYAYFANSYCAAGALPGFAPAWGDHGGPFIAGFERQALLACQFHPELSGAWGTALLRRWLEKAFLRRGTVC